MLRAKIGWPLSYSDNYSLVQRAVALPEIMMYICGASKYVCGANICDCVFSGYVSIVHIGIELFLYMYVCRSLNQDILLYCVFIYTFVWWEKMLGK